MLKILIEAFKRSKGRGPNPIEMLQLRFKAAQQSGKGEVIQFPPEAITDWTKPRPQPQIKKRIKNYKSSTQKIEEKYGIKLKGDETFGEIEEIIKNLPEKKASGGRAGFFVGGMGGIRSLGKKYRGSTLQSLLENPKLVGAELGHDGIMELMNLLPGLFAEGGRAGFFGGGMGRRGFLKLMAALGATGVAAKSGLVTLFKGGAKKQIAKELTSVPIGNASGMPTWFKPLVNKVIKEGDDVTKKAATGEREIVHTKKLDEYDEVTVTQDLDTGNVRVEYHGSGNMGEAPIQLDYKAGEIIEEGSKKGTKTKAEFSAVESEPRITNWDGDIEFDGENIVSKVDDLFTDTTKLESYATGKNPTIKKLLKSEQKKKYVKNLNEDPGVQIEYIEDRHGMPVDDYIDEGARVGDFDTKGYRNYDTKGMNLPDKIKKASGGRVPMIFGGSAGLKAAIASIKAAINKGKIKKIKTLFPKYSADERRLLELGEKYLPRDAATLATREIEGKAQGIQVLIDRIKHDKKILERQAKNKAMKDEGLDFLMKYFEKSEMFPKHIKKYTDIDKDILQLETIKKNLTMKDRKLNASGGLAHMLGE